MVDLQGGKRYLRSAEALLRATGAEEMTDLSPPMGLGAGALHAPAGREDAACTPWRGRPRPGRIEG